MITLTANGKDYLVAAHRLRAHATLNRGVVVTTTYFSTRNGERFGPIRTASVSDKPQSIGGQLFAQAVAAVNADVEAMLAKVDSLTAEFVASGRSGMYPSVDLIAK